MRGRLRRVNGSYGGREQQRLGKRKIWECDLVDLTGRVTAQSWRGSGDVRDVQIWAASGTAMRDVAVEHTDLQRSSQLRDGGCVRLKAMGDFRIWIFWVVI